MGRELETLVMEMHLSPEQGGSYRSLEGRGWFPCAVGLEVFHGGCAVGERGAEQVQRVEGGWVMI